VYKSFAVVVKDKNLVVVADKHLLLIAEVSYYYSLITPSPLIIIIG